MSVSLNQPVQNDIAGIGPGRVGSARNAYGPLDSGSSHWMTSPTMEGCSDSSWAGSMSPVVAVGAAVAAGLTGPAGAGALVEVMGAGVVGGGVSGVVGWVSAATATKSRNEQVMATAITMISSRRVNADAFDMAGILGVVLSLRADDERMRRVGRKRDLFECA